MNDVINCEQETSPITITYDELQNLAYENVTAVISQETALEICKRSVEILGTKTVAVLSLWLQKLLRAYFNEANCCIEVFKCLYAWSTKLKDEVRPENKTACDDFIVLLNDALSFAEWAKDKLAKAGERLVHTALFFLLSIVNGYLQQSIQEKVEALIEHEPVATSLHLTLLLLLKQITASSSTAQARITPLLRQLIEIAHLLEDKLPHLHVFLKTSKTMTDVCIHYSSFTNLNQSMPDWFKDTVFHLCDVVLNNLENAYNRNAVSVEKHCTVAQAYLIMLHKLLSCGVKHIDKTDMEIIFTIFIFAETRATHELNKDLPLLLSKYIRPYVLQLFELIYQLADFQNYLVEYLTGPEQANDYYFEVCLDYITVLILDNTEIEPLNCQTVEKLFEYLFRDAFNFTNAARYNRILEAFGSLLHVADSSVLFKYFLMGLFQEDLMQSQVCADVLMICFRLEDTNNQSSGLTDAMDYFMKCNSSYALFSQKFSQFHIQRMLKYFHKLNNGKQPLFSIRNYRYLRCVSDRNEQDQRLWMMRLRRLLITVLKDTEQFYEMLALMELLSKGQVEWPILLLGTVNELFRSQKSELLTNIYFKSCLKLSQADQLSILKEIKPTEEMVDSCWHAQKFYHAHKNAHLSFKISTELMPLLDALQTPLGCRPTERFDYHKLEYKRYQNHCCNLSKLKRKRTENEAKELIQQLELNSKELQHCSGQLDAADVLQLKSIINNLKHILPT